MPLCLSVYMCVGVCVCVRTRAVVHVHVYVFKSDSRNIWRNVHTEGLPKSVCVCVHNKSHTVSCGSYPHVDPVIKVDRSHVHISIVQHIPTDT